MERKAGRIPGETDKIDKAACRGLEIADHVFVVDRHHRQRQYVTPMIHQAPVGAKIDADIGEVE